LLGGILSSANAERRGREMVLGVIDKLP
jgi:hypothetical protein